ncbi:tetratricopeptide repeat protein [Nocardia sp. SYP-A9097]|uniref:tetratricopeptide repeat protein n=1 Tax=Nocardia sp. SYP-A9097 TaxID=2663237 RepID=UPI00129AFB0A|nr:tetratricopeptide repeat protein [Nocardia sp. SYP-A9097]MRH90219.1 tetratricopeptide repeat protein [Nocardia sp. SYP-A9097]
MTSSHQYAVSTSAEPPLAHRYDSVEPLTWNGAKVYPLHAEAIGLFPTTVTLTLRSTAPRRGVRGLGMGLAVEGGHVVLNDRRLSGVDVWSDAMAGGIELRICPTESDAAISLTPVWVDEFGDVVSWSGNYGMLITRERSGLVLHCSTGVGPPDFTELVVEFATAPTPPDPIPPADAGRYTGALYELGVAMHHRGDDQQACQLWRQAADSGHVAACYDLAVVLLRLGQLAEAEQWWRIAAGHGDARAMAGLAEVLDRRGNPAEARIWRAALDAQSPTY